jgi:copper ion binding protein
MSKVIFEVDGMACSHCKMTVENALKALAGVDSVEVNLKKKTASVSFNESLCAIETMKAAIEAHGYAVTG